MKSLYRGIVLYMLTNYYRGIVLYMLTNYYRGIVLYMLTNYYMKSLYRGIVSRVSPHGTHTHTHTHTHRNSLTCQHLGISLKKI